MDEYIFHDTDQTKGVSASGDVEQKEMTLVAVTDGAIIPMDEVDDEVFSQKMIGDGFAMKPTSNEVLSPIDGKLVEVAGAKHAYYLETKDGIKILIHVGRDTLLLNGKGFTTKFEKDMAIKKGDTLVTFDSELLEEEGFQSTIPVVILDDSTKNMQLEINRVQEAKAGETTALKVSYTS